MIDVMCFADCAEVYLRLVILECVNKTDFLNLMTYH